MERCQSTHDHLGYCIQYTLLQSLSPKVMSVVFVIRLIAKNAVKDLGAMGIPSCFSPSTVHLHVTYRNDLLLRLKSFELNIVRHPVELEAGVPWDCKLPVQCRYTVISSASRFNQISYIIFLINLLSSFRYILPRTGGSCIDFVYDRVDR